MISNRFRLNVIVRIVALAATIHLDIYLIGSTSLYVTALLTSLLVIYQVYALVVYVEKTNRDLRRFFDAIQYEDFTQTFSGAGLGSAFDELKEAFNNVLHSFRRARAEKEEHFRYLQTVVQHIGIGLVAYRRDGSVELMNNAARKILYLTDWKASADLKNIHELKDFHEGLAEKITALKPNERAVIKVTFRNDLLQLVIHSTEFRMREQLITLLSIQNIQSELEEKEMEAWQNLIRVLTHEIMNSVTPISSLASTAHDLIRKSPEPDRETLADIDRAVNTISHRSKGLIEFVQAYRHLTKIPKPQFKVFPVRELFTRVEELMKPKCFEKNIKFTTEIDPSSLDITADIGMIEQILINLIVNSIHALDETKQGFISLDGYLDDKGRVALRVTDNGSGIVEEAMDKIFVPFFTTKPSGSGIGLSLSRQIMRMHKGSIAVESKPNDRTAFTLRF